MIAMYQSEVEIGFKVPGSIIEQVREWERAIDERVFFEQLRTGRLVYDDYEIHPDSFALMKKRYKKHGKIEPYYGCSGCSCSYRFHILPTGSHVDLTVQHGATRDTLSFSSLPFAEGPELPEGMRFGIIGQELENLRQWEEWDADAGLSGRYIFEFFSCGIGSGGVVKNTETGNEINITDYDAW